MRHTHALSAELQETLFRLCEETAQPFQAVIEDEALKVCARPDIGEAKTGDLTGIYAHKFKHKTQEYLMAYHVPAEKTGEQG
jgi:hypothetical protein